jgi:phage baseplate assembly protein W
MPAPTINKIYSDIDFSFTRTPGKNDIALSFDEMAVVRSVRYLLLTNNYERPFQPELGSNVKRLLFEPIDALTTQSLKSAIENTITNFEPRVKLSRVTVIAREDKNAYDVSLSFFIGNNTQPTEIGLMLKRTR